MRCKTFVPHTAVDGAVSDAMFGSYKVLVVGENHCGKTSIIKRCALFPDVLIHAFFVFVASLMVRFQIRSQRVLERVQGNVSSPRIFRRPMCLSAPGNHRC